MMNSNMSYDVKNKLNEWNKLKIKLRSLIIATRHLSIDELNWDYARTNGRQIPYADFNFTNLRECLMSMPDVINFKTNNDDSVEIIPFDETNGECLVTDLTEQPLTSSETRLNGLAFNGRNQEKFYVNKNMTENNFKRRFYDDSNSIKNVAVDLFSSKELEKWRNKHHFPHWTEPPTTYSREELLSLNDTSVTLDQDILHQIPSTHDDVFICNRNRSPLCHYPTSGSPPTFDGSPPTLVVSSSSSNLDRAPILDQTLLPPNVNVTQKIWAQIYMILRDFPDGVDQNLLQIEFSRRYKRSLGGKELFQTFRVKNLRELLFALPNVNVDMKREVLCYKLQDGIYYKIKNARYAKRLKRNQNRTVAENNDFDDDSNVLELPPQPKQFLTEGTQVPNQLRVQIYTVLTKKFANGVDVQTYNVEYNRFYKNALNPKRDCNMTMAQMFMCMKDILVCGRDPHDILFIKPIPYDKVLQTWNERKRCLSSDDDNNADSSDDELTSSSPPRRLESPQNVLPKRISVPTSPVVPAPVRVVPGPSRDVPRPQLVPNPANLNLTRTSTKSEKKESERIAEEILVGNIYEKLKSFGAKGLNCSWIPSLFESCPLLKAKLENIDLNKLLKKFPNLFEMKNDQVRISASPLSSVSSPNNQITSSSEVSTADRSSSPDDNASTLITPTIIEGELKLLFSALKELERWIGFDEVYDFFEFKIKRKMNIPVDVDLKQLILSRPQFFVYSWEQNEILARRYSKSGGTTNYNKKISSLERLNFKFLDDACYDGFFNHLILECDEKLEVTLSSIVDPDDLSVQICALESSYSPLMDTMNKFYNDPTSDNYVVPKGFLSPGFVCAALVSSYWCRVEIIDDIDRDLYLVKTVDYGSTKTVLTTDLRLLKKEFVDITVPAVAVRLALALIEPSNESGYWDPNIRTIVAQYLEIPDAKVSIRVKSIRRADRVPQVHLKTKLNDKKTMDVNDDLVARGFARYILQPNELDISLQQINFHQSAVQPNSFDSTEDDESQRSSATSSMNLSPPAILMTPTASDPFATFVGADTRHEFTRVPSIGRGRGSKTVSVPSLPRTPNETMQYDDNAFVSSSTSKSPRMPTPPMNIGPPSSLIVAPRGPMAPMAYQTGPHLAYHQGQPVFIQPIYVPYPVQMGARHGHPYAIHRSYPGMQAAGPVAPPPGFFASNSSFGFRT